MPSLVTCPPAVASNEAGGIFFIFPKTLFSALLSVSFDAIERSFDTRTDVWVWELAGSNGGRRHELGWVKYMVLYLKFLGFFMTWLPRNVVHAKSLKVYLFSSLRSVLFNCPAYSEHLIFDSLGRIRIGYVIHIIPDIRPLYIKRTMKNNLT